jgi:FAD synthase
VFAVRVTAWALRRATVASLGVRPTKAPARGRCSSLLFDFNESIYGKRVEVEFDKLRDEERYPISMPEKADAHRRRTGAAKQLVAHP